VREADLIFAVGPRLGEMTTGGYTLFDPAASAPDFRARASRREELGACTRLTS
jgi:acetolactate synthase-1/2/3 large subunit